MISVRVIERYNDPTVESYRFRGDRYLLVCVYIRIVEDFSGHRAFNWVHRGL